MGYGANLEKPGQDFVLWRLPIYIGGRVKESTSLIIQSVVVPGKSRCNGWLIAQGYCSRPSISSLLPLPVQQWGLGQSRTWGS